MALKPVSFLVEVTAGTKKQVLSIARLSEAVTLQGEYDNTARIRVGGPEVDEATRVGMNLEAGGEVSFGDSELRGTDREIDLSTIWLDAESGTQRVNVIYWADV